jgi:branched-chain amino acid transport system permease protein
MTGRQTVSSRASRRTLRGRPELYTDYAADQAIWNTRAKKLWTVVLLVAVILAPFLLLSRAAQYDVTFVFIFAIGAIGLNLITGYAGQVSLGHAFFFGVGAYTAIFFGSAPSANLRGLELDMLIWLPMAGIVPMLVGLAVAPLAARVRGLYLAILTLGLVFLGEHLFKELRTISAGPGVGRRGPALEILGFDINARHTILGVDLDRETLVYLFCLALLIVLGLLARNLARSKMGRAFAAVRDRDIAAEVMGVPLLRTKVIAFAISSFYAGVAGGLFAAVVGTVEVTNFGLLLSVDFLAMILIGGVATISGSIIGAVFVVMLPRAVAAIAPSVPFLSSSSAAGAALLTVEQLEVILFGVLIVAFLVLEPRGLYGLWIRVRNYWKAWPFSY